MTVPPDILRLWEVDLSRLWAVHGGLESMLSAAERARAAAIRDERVARRSLAAAAALRVALSQVLSVAPGDLRIDRTCDVCGEPHGPPVVLDAPPGTAVSTSGSGERRLIAVRPHGALGVDIETRGNLRPDQARGVAELFARTERLRLAALAPPEQTIATVIHWTRNEAYLKALRVGVRHGLRGFVISTPPAPAQLESPLVLDPHRRWWFLDVRSPELVGTVAAAPEPSELEWLSL